MKKVNKIIYTGTLAVALSLAFSSCSDFLSESYDSGYTTEYFDTEEGLNSLAISLYGNIRYHFAYEWAYAYTQYGCDEFSTGTDLTSDPWNLYDSRLAPYVTTVNANTPSPDNLWDQMYYGIASSNTIISKEAIFTTESIKNLCLGEAYMLRGYNYFRLISQYGGVVLKTTPSEGVERYFTRSSVEECTKQVIEDLTKAYELLPETNSRGTGGWNKGTAAHFLAKALLFRCSERNDEWNSSYKENDLKQIITLCDYVISTHPLASDFRDLWNWTGIDCAAEKNPELLMVAMFNGDSSAAGRFGNRTFSYYSSQFSNYGGGWVKRGPWVGLDFQRCRPTEYNYSVYDKENDSRFWKSFKTTYNANQTGGGGYNTALGGLAIVFICNDKNDNRFAATTFGKSGVSNFINPVTNKDVPNAFIQYKGGAWQEYGNNIFASLSKFEDGSRADEKNDTGHRDGVLARTGETYLIKAEALVRQNKFQDAIVVINQLRKRAEFKSGEDRSKHTDGTAGFKENSLYSASTVINKVSFFNSDLYKAYSETNSYYLSTGLPVSIEASSLQISSYKNLPTEDEAILSKLNCTSDYDRMLNFIMDERTRELNGEFVRWEDLSRTKLLLRRAQAFNKEVKASNSIKEHHLLRPIPQAFIDGLQNQDGSALSSEQKASLQNPGY